MPSFCPTPLRPATQDAQNTVHRFWLSDGGIGVPPGTGVAPVGKRDPPELPNIFGERSCSGVDVCGPAPAPPPVAAEEDVVETHVLPNARTR